MSLDILIEPMPDALAEVREGPRFESLPPKPWGPPAYQPAPVRQPRERPDTENGWGRGMTLVADGTQSEVARVMLDISEALTVTVNADQPPGVTADTSIPLAVWALITVGNGSTTETHAVKAAPRVDFPVVGTYVSISLFIAYDSMDPEFPKALNLAPVARPAHAAQASGYVSRGTRALPHEATIFITNNPGGVIAASGVLIDDPARIASVQAHLAAAVAGPLFLQLFNSPNPPAPNDVPVAEFSLPSAAPLSDVGAYWKNLRGFSQGVSYGVSSTSGIYTAANDPVWISVEAALF